ncbi:cupin domain-containing protein [Pseudomonas entomophila]|uniref:cupin domain-containing protein n=1 Tax=Pseudomonas entomophila TaxID=312306 RepID=UPI0023D7C846|nr:cupin domain-containing protein [Pseudomonas entomophila]MDF0732289.1 cupin domain-containing protein [Pseudomonas entomophila]
MTTPARHIHRPHQAHWQPMLLGDRILEGITWATLTAAGPWQGYWMRMSPGSRSLPHRHAATELVQVLQGEVVDSDGQRLQAGDSLVYAAGSEHWLQSPNGCLLLVIESQPSSLL